MRSRNFAAALALSTAASLPGLLNASASVMYSFSVSPNPANVGDPTSLDLQVSIIADPGNYNPQITGGSVTFYSGFGASTTINIPTNNAMFADISTSFTYSSVGSYLPTFSAVVDYVEEYTAYGVISYRYGITGYDYAIGAYACGLSTCYRYSPIPEFGNTPQYGYYAATTGVQQEVLTGSDSLAVSPLPTTLPLFATSVGALGLLGWRRSRKSLVAADLRRNQN